MGMFDSMKKLIGIEDVEEEGLTEAEIQAAKEQISRESSKEASFASTRKSMENNAKPAEPVKTVPLERRISVANTNAFKLVLIEPKSFDECPKLVDGLKSRRPIIINLEKIETETAKKIFDFLSGATYALNGSVQKIANNIFIFAPDSVDITANQEDRGGFDFGTNKSPWR